MVITNKNKKSLKSELLEKIRKMADPEFSAEYFEDAMRKFKILNAKGLNNLNTMVLSGPKSLDKNYQSFDFMDKIGESKSFADIVKNLKSASKQLDINKIQEKAIKLFGVKLSIVSKNSDGTYTFLKNPISNDFYGSLEKDLRKKVYQLDFEEISLLFFKKRDDIEISKKQLGSRIENGTDFSEINKLFDDLWELISLMRILSPQFNESYLTIRVLLDRETLELTLDSRNENDYQNFNVVNIEINKELILKSKSMLIGEIKDSMVERFRELSEARYKFCINKTLEKDDELLGSIFDIVLADESLVDQKISSIFKGEYLSPKKLPIQERKIIFESVKRVLEL